jgi:hypothetical protein
MRGEQTRAAQAGGSSGAVATSRAAAVERAGGGTRRRAGSWGGQRVDEGGRGDGHGCGGTDSVVGFRRAARHPLLAPRREVRLSHRRLIPLTTARRLPR